MSEAAPERPRPQAVPARETPGGGNVLTRKVGPLPTWAWLGIIGVGGAAVWIFYKRRQANQAASPGTTVQQGGNCTDTSGNSVPCDQADYGGQVATLQTEIQDLQQGEIGEDVPSPPPPPGTTTPPPSHPPVDSGPVPPPPGTRQVPGPGVPGPVSGLRASRVARTSVTLSWDRTPGATLYYVQLTYQSKTIAARTVATTSAMFNGLRPDSSMHGHVSARNASGQGPTAQVAFHTPR